MAAEILLGGGEAGEEPREKSEHRLDYERKLKLAKETHNIDKDPYYFENSAGGGFGGRFECKLCLSFPGGGGRYKTEEQYLVHIVSKKHQENLQKRAVAAGEATFKTARPRSQDVCYAHQKGTCRRGDTCRFSHGDSSSSAPAAKKQKVVTLEEMMAGKAQRIADIQRKKRERELRESGAGAAAVGSDGKESKIWQKYDDPSSGHPYYYNSESGKTQWTMPIELGGTPAPQQQQQSSQSSNQWGAAATQHTPAAHAASSSGYQQPYQGYAAPSAAVGYGTPAPSRYMGAPVPMYAAPVQAYGAPQYGVPPRAYGAPMRAYGAPAYAGYGAPAQGHPGMSAPRTGVPPYR